SGVIEGTVTDAQSGEVIPGINVGLEGTSMGAATNAEGNYSISNVKAGSYTLVFSAVAYETKRVNVEIGRGAKKTIDVQLQPALNKLQEVEIIGRREQTYKNSVSFAATKTATSLQDI